jgi:hypothetical protein
VPATTLIPGVLMLLGLIAGLVLVLRPAQGMSNDLEANPLKPRLRATVHTGGEQVVLHLARVLGLAIGRDDVGYGEVYLASSSEERIRFLSRSEIGREFQGELVVRRVRDHSVAEYFLLALPDEQLLHQRVRRLERQIVEGIRSLDSGAQIEGPEERFEAHRVQRHSVQRQAPSFRSRPVTRHGS